MTSTLTYRTVHRSAACVLFAVLGIPLATHADEGDIGYPSVDAARKALAGRADVSMSSENGWVTIEDPAAMTLWTFAPETDPAHPAAVKRTVVQDAERVVIRMDIRCEGDPTACDALERHFLSLNESVRDHAENRNDAGDGTEQETDKPAN